MEEMHKYGDHAQSFYALSQGATPLKSPPVHQPGKLPKAHLWGGGFMQASLQGMTDYSICNDW